MEVEEGGGEVTVVEDGMTDGAADERTAENELRELSLLFGSGVEDKEEEREREGEEDGKEEGGTTGILWTNIGKDELFDDTLTGGVTLVEEEEKDVKDHSRALAFNPRPADGRTEEEDSNELTDGNGINAENSDRRGEEVTGEDRRLVADETKSARSVSEREH